MTAAGTLLKGIRPGRLAKDTAHVAFWQAVRIGGQALWVILIARLLGPRGYGAFVGAAGLATALGGFTGLGLGLVMLQDVARDPSLFGDRWQSASRISLASGMVLAILYVAVASLVVGHSVQWPVLIAIALSELSLFPIITLAAFAFSSRHRMGIAAALPALMALCRVLAVLAFWITAPERSLSAYAWFHAAFTLLCAVVAWFWVQLALRPPPAPLRLRSRDMREGAGFSVMWMVGNALNSLDKTLVLWLTSADTAGLYASAYRLATVLALPIDALTMAAGPRLFRHGDGTEQRPGLIPRLLASALLYAFVAAMALYLLAGVLPWLLGPAFAAAVPAARWMALFVPCYGLRLLGSNVLMASNAKRLRAAVEGCALGLLVILAWLWVPTHGLYGAVAMICCTEAALAVAVWTLIWRRRMH